MNSPAPRDESAEHLRLLSIGHYVFAALGFCGLGFIGLHWALMRSVLSQPMARGEPMPAGFEWIFTAAYLFGAVTILTVIVLNFLAARGLAQRRNHTLCIIAAAINCMQVPLGTVLGVLTLLVLMKPEVRASFD